MLHIMLGWKNYTFLATVIHDSLVILDHFTKKSFHWKILTERPFDRNSIWPNRLLTVRRLTESSFYRKVIWTIFFRKWFFDQIYFRQKNSFYWKKNCAQARLTENSIDRKFIWPKAFFWKWSFFDRKVIWLKVHLKSYFRKMVIWLKVFFLKIYRFRNYT
jgi:hypothetical protein